jgi:hypothetical protein
LEIAEYKQVLILLAIVVGFSEEAQEFLLALYSSKNKTVAELLNEIKSHRNLGVLSKHVIEVLDQLSLEIPVTQMKKNADLIARFSFRMILPE